MGKILTIFEGRVRDSRKGAWRRGLFYHRGHKGFFTEGTKACSSFF
jgi:hypothetical protein